MDELKELFESISSDILNDDIKLKMSVLFESTVNEAVAAKEAELVEQNQAEITEFKEELTESIDSYLTFFVEDYIKENETVVEDYAKVKLAEKVLRNFKQMCEAFNISLAEESISQEDEIEELKEESSKLVNKLIEAKKEIQLVKKAAMVTEASEKLETDVQKEKLVEMAKTVEFDEELFEAKINVLVETILAAKTETEAKPLTEQTEETVDKNKKVISEEMKSYLKHL